MQRIIVADTSCLILFSKLGEFELLHRVFGIVSITETVLAEFNHPIPKWIDIVNPKRPLNRKLLRHLDAGEASCIALAAEHSGSLLIIDELKGRKMAKKLGLEVTGSLGVIVAAKNKGIITAVKPLVDKIQQTNFRISEELIIKLLMYVRED